VLAALLLAAPALAADSLDVTDQGLVYTLPGMAKVQVKKDLAFAGGKFDLYLPARRQGLVPVVIFVNGIGHVGPRKLKDWKIYQDWPRLAAARGWAGIVHDAPPDGVPAAVTAIFEHVAAHGRGLGVDADRMAAWACSGNVSTALPYLMGSPPPGVRAAVIYYGAGPGPIRADLPVLHVLAGRDGPQLLEWQRQMRARAAEARAPWTLVDAPTLPHAFDALDGSEASRRAVALTLGFLEAHLAPLPPAPPPSPAREILAAAYGWDHGRAATLLEQRVGERPRDATAWYQLAMSRKNAGRAAEAATAYEKVLELEPGHAGAMQWLGVVQLQANRPEAAAAAFERAVAAGARNPQTLYNLACARARAGRVEPALDALEQAFAAGPVDRAHMVEDPDLASLRAHPRFRALAQSKESRSP
jgi:dienelactone hydrolase